MTDLIRVWVATYGPDPDALDLDRRQNGYTLITHAKPVISANQIDEWAANFLTDTDTPTIETPTGTVDGQAIDFSADGDGFGGLIPQDQKEKIVSVTVPVGTVEVPEDIPLNFIYRSLELAPSSIGTPVVYTYDANCLRVLNTSGEDIREYDVSIELNIGAYADFEPIRRAPNNNVFFQTDDEKIYRVTGKTYELIGSFENIFAFGFDSDSNLYVFDEVTGSDNSCRRYKYLSPDYFFDHSKKIFVNGYADPGYIWAMKGWYQVAAGGGFFFGTSENPNPDFRGDINKGAFYKHNSAGRRIQSVVLPDYDESEFTEYHEVVTGMDEDADGNVFCATHVVAEIAPILTATFAFRNSGSGGAGGEPTFTVSSSFSEDTFVADTDWRDLWGWDMNRVGWISIQEGYQLRITEISVVYDETTYDVSDEGDWQINWMGSWITAPYDAGDLIISAPGQTIRPIGISRIDEMTMTYTFEAGGEGGEGGE